MAYKSSYTGPQIDKAVGIALDIESDLASIHATGTTNTTGATITNTTYFYLNNVLVQAIADIAVNATFTLNTNYKAVTAGGLNELKSALAPLENNAYAQPTSVHENASVIEGGYCTVGKIVVVNCRFSVSANIAQSEAIARFPSPTHTTNYGFISISNNKMHDIGINQNGYVSDSTSGGTGTGTLIISGVYMSA